MLAKNNGHDTEAEHDGTEAARTTEILRPIAGPALKRILGHRETATEKRQKVNKELLKLVGDEVGDKMYFDRVMLPAIEKLYGMEDDEVMAYHLDNLLHMLDTSGINARAGKVARLPLGDKKRSAAPPSGDMQAPDSVEGE